MRTDISMALRCGLDLDLEAEEDFKEALRNRCGLITSIEDDKIYFLHQTVREFLLTEKNFSERNSHGTLGGCVSASLAHYVLAESCIIYISM
jgi:hypothetical protein